MARKRLGKEPGRPPVRSVAGKPGDVRKLCKKRSTRSCEKTRPYKVIVEAEDKQRSEPTDVNRLYFKPAGAQNINPNQTVTDAKATIGRLSVNHINQFPAVSLYFNLKPGVATGDATQFILRTAADVLPPTIRGQLQGEAQTFSQLGILLFVAVFIMYVILGILYESWFHPITVLSSLPVAAVGGLLTLLLFRSELSLYSYIGMFMLIGIVKEERDHDGRFRSRAAQSRKDACRSCARGEHLSVSARLS